MKKKGLKIIALAVVGLLMSGAGYAEESRVPPSPNGIELPDDYKNWRLIASSYRRDNHSLRVILGNDKAVASASNGKTNPWPEGTILAKLVWQEHTLEQWPTAKVPAKLLQAEFMIKDQKRFTSTGGWGFARWVGMEQKPFGKDESFAEACFSCHQKAKSEDFVFTTPAPLP